MSIPRYTADSPQTRRAGVGDKPTAGSLFYATIVEDLGSGSYRATVGKRQVSVQSDTALKPGDTVKVRLQEQKTAQSPLAPAMNGASARTHRLSGAPNPEAGNDALLRSLGIKADDLSRVILHALVRDHKPLDKASIEKLRSALSRIKDLDSDKARKVAVVLSALGDKDLAPSPELVDALSRIVLDEGEYGGDARGESESDPEREESEVGRGDEAGSGASSGESAGGESAGGEKRRESTRAETECLDEQALTVALSRCLREASTRIDGEGGALALFNHAGTTRRIFVPFRFKLDDVAFNGLLDILIQEKNACPERIGALFEAGGASYDLVLARGAGLPALDLRCSDPGRSAALSASLGAAGRGARFASVRVRGFDEVGGVDALA